MILPDQNITYTTEYVPNYIQAFNTAAPARATTKKTVDPKVVNTAIYNFWVSLIANDMDHWKKQFGILSRTNWKKTLYDTRLTPVQKFEKIFGISISKLAPVNLLGNIFDDIGNWFSNQNLQNAEQVIRTGQNSFNQIANALNLLRNSPDVQTQAVNQMNLQNLISQGVATGTSIWDQYGMYIAGGLGIILVIMLMNKR